MTLTFITLNLGKGGAERVFTQLVKALRSDFKISVVSIHAGGYYESYIQDLGVEYVNLGGPNGNTWSYIKRLRNFLKQNPSEVVISFLWYPNIITAFATLGLSIPILLSERSNPRSYLKSSAKLNYFWRYLLGWAYFRARFVVPNSIVTGQYIYEDFKIRKSKIKIIQNGIDFQSLTELAQTSVADFDFNSDQKYLVAVGRLVYEKNYLYLIETFSKVVQQLPEAVLLILGEGEQRALLQKRIEELQLTQSVFLLGFKSNPYAYISKAHVYVMSSKVEGFPNALVEGMFINGHVVSTDCETGPNEIITHGKDGFLVPLNNEEVFSLHLVELLSNAKIREGFYKQSRIKVNNFSLERMIQQFQDLINESRN